jgi:hypothetical protein
MHAHAGGRRHRSVGSLPPSRMHTAADGNTYPPDLFLPHTCAWRWTVTRSAGSLPPTRMCAATDHDTDLPLCHACTRRRTETQVHRLSPSLTHVHGGGWRHKSTGSLSPTRMCAAVDHDTDLLALSVIHGHNGGRRHRSIDSLPRSRICVVADGDTDPSSLSLPYACARRRMAALISWVSASLMHMCAVADGRTDLPAPTRYVSLLPGLLYVSFSHGPALGEEGGGSRVGGQSGRR